MASESFSSYERFFSFEQRVVHIEKFLISSLICVMSTYYLINKNYILEEYLGKNAIYFNLVLFLIFYIFGMFYLFFVVIATLEEAGIQLGNLVSNHKSWTSIILPFILILSGIFILIFVLGYEVKDILGPIIIALVVMAITQFSKISAEIKKRL